MQGVPSSASGKCPPQPPIGGGTVLEENVASELEEAQQQKLQNNSVAMIPSLGGKDERGGEQQKLFPKRVGIVGFGHMGQFLKMELGKLREFSLERVWNRTEDLNEGVQPLSEINAEHLGDIDLVIEVAHPDIVHTYARTILKHCDMFIGSLTALAVEKTRKEIQHCLRRDKHRSVFVPSGALWGSRDIQRMADLGVLKSLTITTILHPKALRLPEQSDDDSSSPSPELSTLHSFCEECTRTNSPKVLYDGPVRQLCLLAPSNVNSMACAAFAAHTLGLDNTRAKLIADPQMRNWQIIEYEAIGENGFRAALRREIPSQSGTAGGETTSFSLLSSVKDTLYRPPGFNIC